MDILELQKLIKTELGTALTPSLEEIKAAIPGQIAEAFAQEMTAEKIKSIVFVDKDGRAFDGQKQGKSPQRMVAEQVVDQYHMALGNRPPHGTDFEALKQQKDQLALTGVSVGAGSSAGNLVPQEMSTEWANLVFRDDPLLSRCRRHPMETDVLLIPTLTGGVTVSWTPEATDTSSMAAQSTGLKPETQITTGQATLTRYCAHARVLVSRKAMRIANPMLEDILNTDIPAAIRAACSKAILAGTATAASDPVSGLDTLVTTNVKTWNVGNPLRGLVDLIQAPGISLGSIAAPDLIVAGPGAISQLMALQDGNNRAYFNFPQAAAPGNIAGIPVIQDFNIPSTYGGGTDSRMYTGNFSRHAHIGMENAMFVLVNPYRYSSNNLVELLYEIYFGFVPSSQTCFAYMNVPTA